MLDLEPIIRREQRADKGPWYTHNPDDAYSMNIYCVTASPVEPDDGKDLENAIAVTLLQSYAEIGNRDLNWEANAEFIAHARKDIPDMIREIVWLRRQLEAERRANEGDDDFDAAEVQDDYDFNK